MIKQSFAYLLTFIVTGLCSFAAIAIYTRLLEPSEYGKYALVITTVTLANTVFFQWIRLSILRFVSGIASEAKTTFVNTVVSLYYVLTACIVVISLLVTLGEYAFGTKTLIYLFAAILTAAQGGHEGLLAYLRSELRVRSYGMLASSKSILALLIGCALAWAGLGFEAIVLGVLIATLGTTAFYFKRYLPKTSWAIDRENLRMQVQYGLPLTVNTIVCYLIYATSRYIVSYRLGAHAVGVFSVPYDFSQNVVISMMMVINLAAFPYIVKTYEEHGMEKAKEQLKTNVLLLFLVCAPLIVWLLLNKQSVSKLLFGAKYVDSASLLMPYIVVAVFINGLKLYYLDYVFHLKKITSRLVPPNIIALVVNVVSTWLLVDRFGVIGVAYATLLTYTLLTLMTWVMALRIVPIRFPSASILLCLLASVLFTCSLERLLPKTNNFLYLASSGVLLLLLYSAALYACNLLGVRDRHPVASLRKRLLPNLSRG
jgi:O-antigen/teichoic acid export membrane protein